jgi:hypothetical protein
MMKFKLQNNTDKPQYCDALMITVPAKGQSVILSDSDYLKVLRHPGGYDWASLIPVAVEGESTKQASDNSVESGETLTRKGRGRHKQESQDE